MKKLFWNICGFILLGFAYVGFILPGIPFSIFLVMAAYSFSKGSERMHNWIYNHKHFGPFLINWRDKKIFPLKMKFMMISVMSLTLIFTYFTTQDINIVIYSGIIMFAVAVWAWRYPNSETEYYLRKENNKKIGWFK